MTSYSLTKTFNIEDRATGDHVEQYNFKKENGKTGKLEIAPSEARELNKFLKKLQDKNAALPKDREQTLALIQTAVNRKPEAVCVYERQAGWRAKCAGFVLPLGYIGEANNVLGVRAATDPAKRIRLSRSGTAKSWRESVGELSRSSSTMMLAVCAAFASPLLKLRKQASFGLCFTGDSRSGKTLATLMAASTIGFRDIESMLTWNATESFLGDQLPCFNDMLFPIDDLKALKGSDEARYKQIRDLTYFIAQGQTKRRHSSFSGDKLDHQNWRCILLTQNEEQIASLAKKAGVLRSGGETFRFIDIPVNLGLPHVFDRTEDATDPNWRARRFREISDACMQNHGAVFESYIRRLIKMKRPKEYIEKCVADFNKTAAPSDDPLTRDISARFALLYAAGRLAVKLKLLDWTRQELLDATVKMFTASCEILPGEGNDLSSGRKALANYVKSLPKKSANLRYNVITGYKEKKGETATYLVKREAFHDVFGSKAERELVLNWLISEKRIELNAPSDGARQPKVQFSWADGKRRRSYRLLNET